MAKFISLIDKSAIFTFPFNLGAKGSPVITTSPFAVIFEFFIPQIVNDTSFGIETFMFNLGDERLFIPPPKVAI